MPLREDMQLISVDDHLVEPPHVWQDRLPAALREIGPRIVREDGAAGGTDVWMYEGRRYPQIGLNAVAGKSPEQFGTEPMRYTDMIPGCYEPEARIIDMDLDGVQAALCFPSFPRFAGTVFLQAEDKALALLCVQAWNDFMLDEWCAAAPERFIPIAILPLWDVEACVAEIQRTAAKGVKAISFTENPVPLGLPSFHTTHWDPVFAAASECGTPLCAHIGSSSSLPKTSPDNPLIITLALTPMNAITTCVDWLFSGNFQRFPDLKLCLSEGGIGWIPYVLERCDYTLERQGAWASQSDFSVDLATGSIDAKSVERMKFDTPSELFRDHVFGCFIDDVQGIDNLDVIGVDNVMIETDFPHTDSSWPHSIEIARKRLQHRSEEDIYKIFQGNAKRVFNFEPAPIPTGDSA